MLPSLEKNTQVAQHYEAGEARSPDSSRHSGTENVGSNAGGALWGARVVLHRMLRHVWPPQQIGAACLVAHLHPSQLHCMLRHVRPPQRIGAACLVAHLRPSQLMWCDASWHMLCQECLASAHCFAVLALTQQE